MAETERGRRTRDNLIATSFELFSVRGFDAVTVDEICESVGVAKGTFYVHFGRKEDVLLAALAAFLGEARERISEIDMSGRDAAEAMLEATRWLLLLGLIPKELIVITMREMLARRADFLAYSGGAGDVSDLLVPLFEAAQARGRLRSDMPARVLARFVDNAFVATVLRWAQTDESQEDLERSVRRVVTLVLEGVLAPSGT
ncbi:MAG: TetR/AcrR family transcriptional regulator [Acidimicrobiia bacterium]|nr:TetR/AcrR family transcriptional regulator [Acidimicrobiia bacterium]